MDKKCKHILISYANENMKYSLKQWELQARNIPLLLHILQTIYLIQFLIILL